jgi:cytoskeletal protein RodZ
MTVGLLLKQAREAAGLSIDEVSALTRIRPQVIRDLEAGNLQSSGGIAYARGHIRSIAKVINADAEVLISQFNNEAETITQSMSALLVENSATVPTREKSQISYKKLSYAALALVLLLILIPAVASFFHSTAKPAPKPSSPAATTSTPVATPSSSTSNTPSSSAAPTTSAAPVAAPSSITTSPGSTVTFTATTANSWFSVADAHGTILWHGTLYKGSSQSFNDSSLIDVTIGNAGAVDVTINGKDAGLSGTIGQVVHVQYGPGAKP